SRLRCRCRWLVSARLAQVLAQPPPGACLPVAIPEPVDHKRAQKTGQHGQGTRMPMTGGNDPDKDSKQNQHERYCRRAFGTAALLSYAQPLSTIRDSDFLQLGDVLREPVVRHAPPSVAQCLSAYSAAGHDDTQFGKRRMRAPSVPSFSSMFS